MMPLEDSEAWRQATEGTIPLPATQQSKVPPSVTPAFTHMKPAVPQIRLSEMQAAFLTGTLPTLDAKLVRRIRVGKVTVERTLDLHGMTQAAAYDAFQRFMYAAYGEGIRLVLVITGKGRVTEAGVLRTALPKWCAEPPLRQMIIAFHQASPLHGGEGAWYIRVRKYEG